MAFTKAPETQTYDSPKVPAAFSIHMRPNSLYTQGGALTQDAGMVNLIPVNPAVQKQQQDNAKTQDQLQSITRQAITAATVVGTNLINRGCYVWEKTAGTTYYFSVNGTGVYTSTDGTTWALVNTLLTSATTPVRFAEFINDSNVKSLVLVDGIEGYIYTSNAAGTKITDPEFPSPHLPYPVFLDGYLFLAKKDTGDIYNSDLNDPAVWTAGSFISSELYPDDIQALVKINNYLLAVGLEGSEYFYDAAVATGSPMARYEGGSLAFGTLFPNSIACNKRQMVMLCNNNDGEFVLKVIEDFKAKDIDPGFLTQVLNARLHGTGATNAAAVRAYFMRQAGDLLYVINLQGDSSAPDARNKTFALNLDTGYWTELRIGSNGEAPYPVYFTGIGNSTRPITYISGHYNGAPFFGYLQETTTAEDVIGSSTIPIYVEMRTPNVDFAVPNLKTMSRFGVDVATNSSTTATAGSSVTLNVSWSDDDYATFSTPRPLIFSAALNYPFITQLGAFRQRAFKLTYNGPYHLMFKSLNVDINKGQQ